VVRRKGIETNKLWTFAFFIPCKTNKMLTLRYYYNNVLAHINSYVFRASLAHHQGVHSCITQRLDLIIICNTWNGWRFIDV